MAETITHAFVSAKSDSPDITLVSASEWNDGHVFNGGINGQVLVYDNTQPNNIRWTDGASSIGDIETISNPTASPMTAKVSVDFTSNSPVIITAYTSYLGITTTGAVTYSAILYIDGNAVSSDSGIVSGSTYGAIRTGNFAAGAHNVHVDFASTGAVAFTGGLALLQVAIFGR